MAKNTVILVTVMAKKYSNFSSSNGKKSRIRVKNLKGGTAVYRLLTAVHANRGPSAQQRPCVPSVLTLHTKNAKYDKNHPNLLVNQSSLEAK